MATQDVRKLVVLPSEPLEAWEKAGYISWLPGYFNPEGLFDEVFVLSPLEECDRQVRGVKVVSTTRRDFAAKLTELQPDVIRTYSAGWGADLLARTRPRNVPTLASVHTTPPNPVHASLRWMDLVISISEVVTGALEKVGVDPQRIRKVPNRVDTNVFHPTSQEPKLEGLGTHPGEGKYILFVGRKTESKNLDTLVRAVQRLPREYNAVLVGEGNDAEYKELAQKLGIDDRCYWINRIENAKLPPWYCWCDCMCVPSRWEGFGIVFIEAAACGAVVVTSDIAPMNEYLTDGHNACLVEDYEDPEAVASAIKRACECEQYRRRLSTNAPQAAEPFSRQRVDAIEADVYREALQMEPPNDRRWAELQKWRRYDRTVGRLRNLTLTGVVRGLKRRMRALVRRLKPGS